MNKAEEFICGYQYSPDGGHFIGEYRFPKNKTGAEGESVHLPPFTTLTPPPSEVPAGHYVKWEAGGWVVRQHVSTAPAPLVEDYLLLEDWYIQHLRDSGQWTEEMQSGYEAELARQTADINRVDSQVRQSQNLLSVAAGKLASASDAVTNGDPELARQLHQEAYQMYKAVDAYMSDLTQSLQGSFQKQARSYISEALEGVAVVFNSLSVPLLETEGAIQQALANRQAQEEDA